MEMLVTVTILAVLAFIAVNRLDRIRRVAVHAAAEADLRTLREAFMAPESGYLHDMAGIPGFSHSCLRIANLFMPTNVYGSRVNGTGILGAQTREVRVDEGTEAQCRAEGRALPEVFTQWDEERYRGWHGPYVSGLNGVFPAKDARRFNGDATFEERGFFPSVQFLRLPTIFRDSSRASVYGFTGEPALYDPWGNPYVVQVPPPQAFTNVTTVSALERFRYARLVSAGPDGILETPCFPSNSGTNWSGTVWNERERRSVRQAGLLDVTNRVARGDDIVLFFSRNDIDEGEEQ